MNRFDNGLDSLRRALNALGKQKKTESDYKDEIVFFHNALELLFKQLLYEAHPLLLYPDVDKTIKKAFERRLEGRDIFKSAKGSLDVTDDSDADQGKQNKIHNDGSEDKLHTVEFIECIKRLCVADDIVITGNIFQSFIRLNELRNAITHDELDFQRSESEQTVIDLLPVLIDICERKFDGQEKGKFSSLIASKKKKIKDLYRDNYINSVNSYLSLLSIYSDKGYDDLTDREKRKLHKTAELFYGKITKEDADLFITIGDEYYISLKSFLSQKLCEYVMERPEFEDYKNSTKLKNICQNNKILADVVDEYVVSIIYQIEELLVSKNDIDFTETEIKKLKDQVRKHLDEEEFIINLFDIYYYIMQLREALERVAWVVPPGKNGGKYAKTHKIPDNETITIVDFVDIISVWFKDNGWKNGDEVKEKQQIIIDSLDDYPFESLFSDNITDELIGTGGYAGTIDRIDEKSANLQKVCCIIDDKTNVDDSKKKGCRVIVEISVNTESYFDGDYFPGGRENFLYVLKGIIDERKFGIEKICYLDTFHKPRLEKLMVTL